MRTKGESTEFFNISTTVLDVMRAIARGIEFRREIEDRLKISEKHALRAIDKLADAGMISVVPCREPGRAGKNVRLFRVLPTETGFLLLTLCQQIEKNRNAYG